MDISDSPNSPKNKDYSRLKIAGAVLTLFGIGLFFYFVYSIGLSELLSNVERFGIVGFIVILIIYFVRVVTRALAWRLSVHEPYFLSLKDTIPAVVIGEAMSNTIPLGILVSGTSKAVAVRRRIPLVAGLSSVATENLFYSFVTGICLIIGALLLLGSVSAEPSISAGIWFIVSALSVLIFLGVLMVIRQWHFASELCEMIYRRGYLKRLLENGRLEVRLFENLIYGFYRRHPRRFIPICLLEATYFLLGVTEVWYVLSRLSGSIADLSNAFVLETVSRMITILFKMVPFVIGVDEAGAQFVAQTVSLAAGLGITLAIIRKGRMLFWTAIGWLLIAKRGLTLRDVTRHKK